MTGKGKQFAAMYGVKRATRGNAHKVREKSKGEDSECLPVPERTSSTARERRPSSSSPKGRTPGTVMHTFCNRTGNKILSTSALTPTLPWILMWQYV